MNVSYDDDDLRFGLMRCLSTMNETVREVEHYRVSDYAGNQQSAWQIDTGPTDLATRRLPARRSRFLVVQPDMRDMPRQSMVAEKASALQDDRTSPVLTSTQQITSAWIP